MTSLIDTNILVYRFDGRYPEKQTIATETLRRGIEGDSVRLPHQAIVEFTATVTRAKASDGLPLLPAEDARREAEEFLSQFDVLYPTEALIRTALRGTAAYQLSWFDAHLWAYAEERAAEVFFDPFAKLVDATRNDEAREALIGVDFDLNLLYVAHVAFEAETRIRIISARPASGAERKAYED